MANVSSVKNLQQLQTQLEECVLQLQQTDSKIDKAGKECEERFAMLAYDIKTKIGMIKEKSLLNPFARLFGSAVAIDNGYITIYGQAAAPISFNADNCAEVYKQARDTFFGRCKNLFSDPALWDRFRRSADSLRLFGELASMFNTFLAIYQEIPVLSQEKKVRVLKELNEQRNALLQEEKDLSEKIRLAREQHDRIAKNADKIRLKTDFSNDIVQETEFRADLSLPLGYSTENCGELDWRLNDFNGVRIVVPTERIEGRDPSVCRIAENAVLHFLRAYPAGAARLAVFDACKMLRLEKLCAELTEPDDSIQDETDKKSIEDAVIYKGSSDNEQRFNSAVACAFEEIYDMLASSKTQNLTEFNCTHTDSFQPIVLFVIYGCPSSFRIDKEKANLIGNAGRHGVYLLIVEEESKHEEDKRYFADEKISVAQLRDMMTLRLTSAAAGDLNAEYEGGSYRLATPSERFDMKSFTGNFQNMVLEQYKKPLRLENLFSEYKRGSADFSKVLHIPVGREENGDVKLLSFSSLSSTAHLAMIGKTGSGKSSVLQAIVLGGAYYYSPDELEFYLIDMKGGDAFYKKDVVEYSKLKHVKMLAAGCSEKDLKDFIAHIVKTKLSFNNAGPTTDIIEYNKLHTGKDKMKRTVIVIDEYTQITDPDSVDALTRIARQGRSAGISLVLSSLDKGNSKILTNNVGNLVEFKNDTAGALIDSYSSARVHSSDRMFLIGRVGNCISSITESDKISHFRAAYMKPAQQAEFIELINAKYAAHEAEDAIIIGDSKQMLKPRESAAERTAASEYDDAVFAANIGRGTFGTEERIEFGAESHQTKNLLLIGDLRRAQSIEYSLLCAAKDARKYYLSFGGRANEAFCGIAEVNDNEDAIEEALRKVYSMYQERKQGAEQTPVLMIFHDFGQGEKLILKKPKPLASDKEEAAPVRTQALPGFDEEDLVAKWAEKYASPGRSGTERRQRSKYRDTELVQILRELTKEGVRYGICTVFACDYDGIPGTKEMFGTSVSEQFKNFIAIPSLRGEAIYAKGNLLRALDMLGTADLLKKNSFTRSELVRCYHVIDKNYKQFIPYEWE